MTTNTYRFDRYKKTLIEIIHKHIPTCKIHLFGSRARKTHRPGADIDLAIDSQCPINVEIILAIQNDIDETTIPLTVDLVDMQTAPEKLKNEIIREGILWTL